MRRGLGVVTVALALAGCGGSQEPEPTPTPPGTVSGPLCDVLPAGDDPGAPETLTDDSAAVALTWIPVITTFEAAVRATGLDRELHEGEPVTILAPTDDAFDKAFSRRRLDDLLLKRHDELRALLDNHLIDGALSLADLREQGSVTTRAGETLEVTRQGAMARLGGRATTLCADYAAANARIHVVDGVLR